MAHFDKVMLQNLARRNPLGGVELQHRLEHVHEHQPICVFHNFVRNIVVTEETCLKEEKNMSGMTSGTFSNISLYFF